MPVACGRPILTYRSLLFSFTRTVMCGSRKRLTFDPARDIPDLTGKVAIVTGGK